jgi:hypothetical protein
MHRKDYFLAQLLDSHAQRIEIADGEEEAKEEEEDDDSPQQYNPGNLGDFSMPVSVGSHGGRGLGRGGAKRHRRILPQRDPDNTETDEDFDESPPASKRPMDTKQKLLHILSTEISINRRIHGEITALHTTFDNWDPLLPHATVRVILKFFGVSSYWLEFFDKFLEAPLKFIDEHENTPPRIRRRGVPASHVLSTVFSEVVLFCLDFSINRLTDGALLYRLYDDLWFWSPKHQLSVKTWHGIQRFAKVTGTQLDHSKTGTVRISADPEVSLSIDSSLPVGHISWGFLRLSPETGRFEINQPMVDKHINELQKQLQSKLGSVFSFIQTWNTYAATFFTSNFGKPANCFGRRHVDLMLSTHSRIQRQIFKAGTELRVQNDAGTASVVDYLKGLLKRRFNIKDIPDAYLFFPVELGGLDLESPFISILQIRDSILKDPSELLDKFEESERDHYYRAKNAFEKGEITHPMGSDLERMGWEPVEKQDRKTFLDFEEFTRWREEYDFGFSPGLPEVYEQLLEKPKQETLDLDNERIASGLSALAKHTDLRGILADWNQMEPYWKWVVMQYGPEVMERFGDLNIVDPGLLPMGMVSLYKDKRVKWQG